MRWDLFYLSAALIALAGAQFQTIENGITVVEAIQVAVGPAEHNVTANDDIYSNSDGMHITVPQVQSSSSSDSSAIFIRQSRETNERNSELNDSPVDSDQHPDSQESHSGEYNTTTSEESQELNDITENANSTEFDSGIIGSAEITSSEEPGTELNSTISPVEASNESFGAQSSQDITETSDYEVETTHGRVKGFQWQDNTDIIAYYDIPYGIFKKPFEPPVTARSWNESVHQATQHTTVCPQLEADKYVAAENCLTLSIFTPKNAENASVLFHIYDGDFNNIMSADPLIYGPDYLVPKGIILVLPNYRIGPMGFLCMQNETAPGNAGLKDLSLALEWVHDNVHNFGGNAGNIAVSGDGAAGAYAGYLALCSPSKHYIKKVITESGSALSHWALDRNPIRTAYQLASKLREQHAEGIIFNNTFDEMALETIIRAAQDISFKPCIEIDKEPLIDDTPWTLLQKKEINANFMIGSATYAGTHEATDATEEFVEQINKHFELLLPEDLEFKNEKERDKFTTLLREQYFGKENITVNHVDELSLWYTDASYLSPGIRLARPLSEAGATVYLYEFAYVGDLSWALEALNKPVQGAVRGDLVGYLFRRNGAVVEDDSSEKRMIDLMVDLWVSFINTGKPAAANVDWHELKTGKDEEEELLYISSEPKLKKGIHVERLRVWTELYERHFIDNSARLAGAAGPHACLALALLICLIANNKLNYGTH